MYDAIIIGAGPSGLMAGIQCHKKVLIIEKNSNAGKKLLLTGGGRCNLTNKKDLNTFLENVNHNKKYLYSTINTFGPKEIMLFFEQKNVKLKQEEDGKIFPVANKSFVILEALLNSYKGDIHFNEEVIGLEKGKVITNKNIYETKKIIIATGGLSFPQTGSTGDNLKFAKMIKQPITNVYPAEVSINLIDPPNIPGTSIDNVLVKCGKIIKEGNLIYTHKGLSGTSVMLMSEHIFKEKYKEIEIDNIPYQSEEILAFKIKNFDQEKEIHTFLSTIFSKKYSDFILEKANIKRETKIKQLGKKNTIYIINILKHMKYSIKSVESLKNAYVTGGGIDMKFINSKTFESTINPTFYFIGEALDIHGPIGGYNLTLALSTGYSAGKDL
ncbi:MAG: aminoacetone oxidase family FAD-binding enzyme [Bacilli bacterium]